MPPEFHVYFVVKIIITASILSATISDSI